MELVLFNGTIHTFDPINPSVDCIVVRDGRVVVAGGKDLLSQFPHAKRLDLEGATLLPAFTDAHIHWSWTSRNLQQIDLFGIPSKEQTLSCIAGKLDRFAEGEWVTGFGWAQGYWPGMEFPAASDLDALSTRQPMIFISRSGHSAWVNSLALQMAGLDASTANPPGGEIARDASGAPSGILFEEAIPLVRSLIPPMTVSQLADAVEAAQPEAWKTGIASLHDYDGPDAFEAYSLLRERDTLRLRILKNINDPYIHHAHALGLRQGFGDDWLRIGALKIFADGAMGSVTALMIDPYQGEPENRGIEVTPPDRMKELVLEATRRGFASTIHAIGDQAVRNVLEVLEAARAEESRLGIPRKARRHRIEHHQFVHPDDRHRLANLGGIASIQPIHATSDYPMVDRYLGLDTDRHCYDPRVFLDAGGVVVFGSDAPVEPFDPLAGIHAAVTRRRADGSPGPEGWRPHERITVEEAIRAYTQGPAWTAGWEDRQGKIAPGYFADFVALDRDPIAIDPNDLLTIRVVMTIVNGQLVYAT